MAAVAVYGENSLQVRFFPIALVISLSWGALAIGGAPDWAAAPLLVLALTTGALGLLERRAPGVSAARPPLAVMLAFLILVLSVGAQLIPLTPQVVARLSPAHDIADFDRLLAVVNYRDPEVLPARPADALKPLSIAPARTLVGLAGLLGFGMLLFGTARALSIVSLRRIVLALMMLGVVVSFVRFWRVADPDSPIYGLYVPLADLHHSAPFTNHNHLAGWLVMVLSLALGMLAAEVARGLRGVAPNWRDRLLWFASKEASQAILTLCIATVMAICVLVSNSRSGATIMSVVFVMFIGLTLRKQSFPLGRRPLAIALSVVLVGAFWVAGADFSRRLAGTEWARMDGRVAVWQDTLRIFNDFPLTGSGFNTYAVAMLHYQTVDDGLRYQEAHNEYLQLLSDGGILVAAPMLVFAITAIVTIRRRFREGGDDTLTHWLRIGAVWGIVAIALQSLLDFTLQTPGGAVMFATLLAIAIHSPRRQSSNRGAA
jgi:O-antigen ligase